MVKFPRHRPKRGRVKAWSEYDRPGWAPPAPELWDVITASDHIVGPFETREAADDRLADDTKRHEERSS